MRSVEPIPELRDWNVWRSRSGDGLRNVSALKVPRGSGAFINLERKKFGMNQVV